MPTPTEFHFECAQALTDMALSKTDTMDAESDLLKTLMQRAVLMLPQRECYIFMQALRADICAGAFTEKFGITAPDTDLIDGALALGNNQPTTPA